MRESNGEVLGGLVAILLAFLFVIVAFATKNVMWVVPGMVFGIAYMVWVFHRHGMPSVNGGAES